MMRLRQIVGILAETLREIFDESAYRRFLNRTHASSSPEAYASFRREYETAKTCRPRCC